MSTVKYTGLDASIQNFNNDITHEYRIPGDPLRAYAKWGPFTFHNLRPNTKYKIFYDNINVTKWSKLNTNLVDVFEIQTNGIGSFENDFFVANEYGILSFFIYYGAWQSQINSEQKQYFSRLDNIAKPSSINIVPYSFNIDTTTITVDGQSIEVATNQNVQFDSNGNQITGIHGFTFADQQNTGEYVSQNIDFDLIQTFYIDPAKFDNAKTIDLTEVLLYPRFKDSSPARGDNIKICLLDVENNVPVKNKQYKNSLVVQYDNFISTSTNATNYVNFTFASPVRVKTGKKYGIGIQFSNGEYELWSAKPGDRLAGTNTKSNGPKNEHRGELFVRNNYKTTRNDDGAYDKSADLQLKFDVNVALYDNTAGFDFNLVPEDYEFFNVSNTTSYFIGGEPVYQETANSTGTVSVTAGESLINGSGTTFTSLTIGDNLVVTDGSVSNTELFTVISIISDTQVLTQEASAITFSSANFKVPPVGFVDTFDLLTDKLYLVQSNAKSGKVFAEGETVIGVDSGATAFIDSFEDFEMSVFAPDVEMHKPSVTDVSFKYYFTYDDAGTYRIANESTNEKTMFLSGANHIDKYKGLILSRSKEIANPTYLYDTNGDSTGDKSGRVKASVSFTDNSTRYESPKLNISDFYLTTSRWSINNDATNEHTLRGNAVSKNVSTRLVFDNGQFAEDVRVVCSAYRPVGTDFKVYAKVLNSSSDSEAFDDKSWTELQIVTGENQFSVKENLEDFREFVFGLPPYPPSESTLDGVVDTLSENSNNAILGTGTSFNTDLVAGDIIKVYDPIFPTNYGIFGVVNVVGAGEIEISEQITNLNIVGEGLKIDKLSTPRTAFNNGDNLNIVRYFDLSGAAHDTYDVVALKIVLLSSDYNVVPSINEYRVVGVSS